LKDYMAEKKRILVVTQEFHPFTDESFIANITHAYSQYLQENGMEVRILMPRFGSINERRHRLHEVVRLSGMNITVDDDDYPLIIKVASLPGTRMQIYFLDNEEFFKRKKMFTDQDEKPFEDNLDRMIFFGKGVIETVKKFGWAPDLVHCHGWMTSLIPAYMKNHFKNEPIFRSAKFVYTPYTDPAQVSPNDPTRFSAKISSNQMTTDCADCYVTEGKLDLHRGAAQFSDAIVISSEMSMEAPTEVPVLCSELLPDNKDWSSYLDFFNQLMLKAEQTV